MLGRYPECTHPVRPPSSVVRSRILAVICNIATSRIWQQSTRQWLYVSNRIQLLQQAWINCNGRLAISDKAEESRRQALWNFDLYDRERLLIQREKDGPGKERRLLGRHHKKLGFHSALTGSEASVKDIDEFSK